MQPVLAVTRQRQMEEQLQIRFSFCKNKHLLIYTYKVHSINTAVTFINLNSHSTAVGNAVQRVIMCINHCEPYVYVTTFEGILRNKAEQTFGNSCRG